MALFDALKIKRSAGVRVTRPVHAAIARGNDARGRYEWASAARYYEQALALDPTLVHIWIQIGHMYKEGRAWERSVHAYAEAAKLAPTDPAVIGWLFEIAGRLGNEERQRVTAALEASFPNAVFRRPESRTTTSVTREIVFDVSDLVAYFARARVPTGIQRVQIEVIRALAADAASPRICCAIEGRDAWVEIPADVFGRITDIATGGDRFSPQEWVEALAVLQLSLLLGEPIEFTRNAVLVNLGTSWWLQNYFLQIRNAQAESGIEYLPFIHDLIPVMTPQHCVDGLVEDFIFWVTSVFKHANRFLVNSEATKRDLLTVARKLGHTVSADAVTVVRLDAAFAKPKHEIDATAALHSFGLAGQPFILFVSTIESRKDHVGALRVWQRMLAKHGSATPKLVCVGNNGWLNEPFYELLASDPAFHGSVILLNKISDDELALLYRECLFTIYPSTYEGWGLPVTEALSYGKPVVAANNSSLPEAGGALALYFESGDLDGFTELVERLSFDTAYRASVSEAIADGFRPREWIQVARQITDAAMRPAQHQVAHRELAPGCWYDLSRSRERAIWRGSGSSEIFRVGYGWADVDRKGAWIRSDKASLAFGFSTDGPHDVAMRLLARFELEYQVRIDNRVLDTGTIEADADRWVVLHLDMPRRHMSIDITCFPTEATDRAGLRRALCVTGFAMTSVQDCSTQRFFEAVALNRLDRITAFRRPAGLVEDDPARDGETNIVSGPPNDGTYKPTASANRFPSATFNAGNL